MGSTRSNAFDKSNESPAVIVLYSKSIATHFRKPAKNQCNQEIMNISSCLLFHQWISVENGICEIPLLNIRLHYFQDGTTNNAKIRRSQPCNKLPTRLPDSSKSVSRKPPTPLRRNIWRQKPPLYRREENLPGIGFRRTHGLALTGCRTGTKRNKGWREKLNGIWGIWFEVVRELCWFGALRNNRNFWICELEIQFYPFAVGICNMDVLCTHICRSFVRIVV